MCQSLCNLDFEVSMILSETEARELGAPLVMPESKTKLDLWEEIK